MFFFCIVKCLIYISISIYTWLWIKVTGQGLSARDWPILAIGLEEKVKP